MKRQGLLLTFIIAFSLLLTFPSTSVTGSDSEKSSQTHSDAEEKSVGGSSGEKGGIYVVGRGFKKAGKTMEKGFVKAGKSMDKGFKKAGRSIKNFFTGEKENK